MSEDAHCSDYTDEFKELVSGASNANAMTGRKLESVVSIRRAAAHKAMRLIEEIEHRVARFMNERELSDLRAVRAALEAAVTDEAEAHMTATLGEQTEVIGEVRMIEEFAKPGAILQMPQGVKGDRVRALLGRPFQVHMRYGAYKGRPFSRLAREVLVDDLVVRSQGERLRAGQGDVVMRLAAGGHIVVSARAFESNFEAVERGLVGEPDERDAHERARRLVNIWQQDESGYDQRVSPKLKEAIEEHRLSDRRRFDDDDPTEVDPRL